MLPSGERGATRVLKCLISVAAGIAIAIAPAPPAEAVVTISPPAIMVMPAVVVPAAAILHVLRTSECTIKGRRMRACSKRKTIA
jgi:hypothetical protein